MAQWRGPKFRTSCAFCVNTRKTAYWATDLRTRVIARCTACRGNFHGKGKRLPAVLALSSARGIDMLVDPCATCGHGDGPHFDAEQKETTP